MSLCVVPITLFFESGPVFFTGLGVGRNEEKEVAVAPDRKRTGLIKLLSCLKLCCLFILKPSIKRRTLIKVVNPETDCKQRHHVVWSTVLESILFSTRLSKSTVPKTKKGCTKCFKKVL